MNFGMLWLPIFILYNHTFQISFVSSFFYRFLPLFMTVLLSADAEECFNKVVNLFLENDRLNMTARYCKELGESYELQQDFRKAIDYLERVADLFENEEVTSSANQYKKKVAHLAAQLEQYPKAIEIFEETARQSVHSNLLRHSVKGILLNSEICELCKGDVEIDPAFAGTHEHKLLTDLAAAVDEEDVEKFTGSIKDFDGITRLDPWKTALLLRAKNKLHEKKNEEDDLT
ncbi:hypothetical protein HPP92_002118 [Vanilla planifolia]|uniref:Uncharacterized protein n=1 Tax=Vanilla planifolia TaxID=51239 RepID=A0A835S4P9_VANPL|nr:hypothetical protein HPP92_002118 [Vanilla planifolia]